MSSTWGWCWGQCWAAVPSHTATHLGTAECVAPGWLWNFCCASTHYPHNAWARRDWRATATTSCFWVSLAAPWPIKVSTMQFFAVWWFWCIMRSPVCCSGGFGLNLYSVNNKERCEAVMWPWVSQSFVVSFSRYLLCCGWWGPKGFKFSKANCYWNEPGDSLKWWNPIITMEGRNDCLLCPCGLLLASRFGFGQVSGSQSCSIFCVVLKRLWGSFLSITRFNLWLLLCPPLSCSVTPPPPPGLPCLGTVGWLLPSAF